MTLPESAQHFEEVEAQSEARQDATVPREIKEEC